ncbi:acetyl-CoA carboxylase biotin carboxylase subunit family protein [Sphingomonas sp. CJ20]
MSRTLMVLGGAAKSLPLVLAARRKGHRVVLCDRDPSNPCRGFAQVFLEISTMDRDALVRAAREEAVDGIVSFGSDRMAEVVADVASACGLPGNPPEAVRILGRKDLFRAFLAGNGFATPRAAVGNRPDAIRAALHDHAPPLIVKPVDSAGSAGVTRIDSWAQLPAAFDVAQAVSPSRAVIVETFLDRAHAHMVAGDAFVVDGRVAFWGLLNSHRGATDAPFLPTGTSHPVQLSEQRQVEVRNTIQALVDALGLRFGPLNLELMYARDDTLHIIEVGARNGGNAIPELIEDATGVDLVGALVDAAVREPVRLTPRPRMRFSATYVVHSHRPGRFRSVELDPAVRPHVYRMVLFARPGDEVRAFDCAPHAVGMLFLDFATSTEQHQMLARINACVSVRLDPIAG